MSKGILNENVEIVSMKKKVAIIGVTGSVGQEFVQSLNDHPWFEVTQIAASERSAGKNILMQSEMLMVLLHGM